MTAIRHSVVACEGMVQTVCSPQSSLGSGRRGFTLIESVIALAVLGVASVAVLLIFAEATARSADPQIRAQARAVSEAYMDEILLQAYTDPDGNESGETRASYDDVWDYDGLGPELPTNQFGDSISGLGDYKVTVDVDGTPGSGPAEITVTTRHSSGRVAYDLYGERADY